MDKINISTLFSIPEEQFVGGFGTDSFAEHDKKVSLKKEIDSIFRMEEKRYKLKIKLYRRKFKKCIYKIKNENMARNTETIYEIDETILGEPAYDVGECLSYVVAELRKYNFDVLILEPTKIFISWKFLRYHKNDYHKNDHHKSEYQKK